MCVCARAEGAEIGPEMERLRGRMIKDVWWRQFSRKCVDGSISLSDRSDMRLREADIEFLLQSVIIIKKTTIYLNRR